MIILKIANIEKFQTLFSNELHQEQKYLPISSKLVVLLNDMNPTLAWIDQNIKFRQKIMLDVNLQIHKNYVNQIESLNRDLLAFNETHKQSLDQFQKDKILNLQKINAEQKQIVKSFEEQKEKLKIEYEEKLKQFETQLKREQSQFEKEKLRSRKIYQALSKEIEEEEKHTLLNLEKRYASIINEVNVNIEQFNIDKQKELTENEALTQTQKVENDKVYLSIKNNYHLLTTQFNQAINKLKKVHEKAKNTLEVDHNRNIEPVNHRLEQLNLEYQETIDKVKKQYQSNLLRLDDEFNQQKTRYEEKKAKIIHTSNETITLLNSKLSAFRESIAKDKIEQSRLLRDEIKQADSVKLKDKINRDLTNVLRSLDNDLNKQIIRTQKDIVIKQKELQQALYNHDLKHLSEMNTWRLQRNLLSYQYKQELAKIDLNFNHNLSISKKHLTLLEETYKYQLHVLNITLKKDLLQLETQLQIQSHVQERELNLLNNDQHLSNYLKKYDTAKINYEYEVNIENETLRELKAKLDFESETQVVQITSQLELEKVRSKRDFTQSEQEIRSEIAVALFEKNKHHILKAYELALEDILKQEKINQIEKKYQIEKIKLDQQKKHHNQEYLSLEKKSIHQTALSHQKALRLMKLYLNELNDQQKQSEYMFYGLRMFYQKHQHIKRIVKELYLLPAHPEVFKHMLSYFLSLETSFQEGITALITYFKDLDHQYYQKKIDDQTEYKYMIKHEDSMNLFEQELEKIKSQEKEIKKEIESLEQQFFIVQQNLERQTQFVSQLEKINENIQSGLIPSKSKHKDIKDNKHLIHNHEKEIKSIRHKLSLIEKAIDKKHLKLMPFEKQIDQIKDNMLREEKILKTHQQKESNFYEISQTKNQKIYDLLLSDFMNFTNQHISYLKTLEDTLYVTDSQLTQEEKKLTRAQHAFEQKLVKHQQAFLNHMFDFYQENDNKQDDIISDFDKSQTHWIDELKKNNQSVLDQIDKFAKKNITHKEKDINDLEDLFKTEKAVKLTELDKKFNLIQQNIKTLENKLKEHLDFMKQELKSINDNQVQIANQSYLEYQKAQEQLNMNNQKHLDKFKSTLDQEDKTYSNFVQSTENKNQTLLSRFEQNREKQLEAHKQKNEHFDQDMNKSKIAQEKRIKAYDKDISSMQENRAYEIKNMNDHIKKYQIKSEKQQHRILKGEQKSLRKNYRFKLKQLHLK